MNLQLDLTLGENYSSNSQKIRRVTEGWFEKNMFCPRCGNEKLQSYENNRPVADFYCESCENQYELKSKNGGLGKKVNDGAYHTMIERITSLENPNLFCMNYSSENYIVEKLILIPKHFFIPAIIEKRNPLSANARRAGWVGCNILIDQVPEQGKIEIIRNGRLLDKDKIVSQTQKAQGLKTKDIKARGWLLDVLTCINKIENKEFQLAEMYNFEKTLSISHPENNNIQAKIRQQLQFLRDKGFIEFLGSGKYRKIN